MFDLGPEMPTYGELPVSGHPPMGKEPEESEELSLPEVRSLSDKLSRYGELSQYGEPSVPEELPVPQEPTVAEEPPASEFVPLTAEMLVSPAKEPKLPPWILRLMSLACIVAMITVCLVIFLLIKGYASSSVDGVEILSKTQEVTTASPDISKTSTLVEILGLPAANVAFDESEITKNDLHILEQRTEAPRPTTIEIPDIPTKITILEEYKNVKNTHYSEELEDINPQEKKEEGLPPPYARVCETNTECPRGYRCLDATCVRGCDYTDDCPNDYHCKYGRYGYRCFEKPGRSRECKAHGQFCRRHSHCCTGYCGRRSKGRDLLCTPMPGGVDGHAEAAEEE